MQTELAPGMDIGIGNENRGHVVRALRTLLADEYLLYTKTRNYHWNVVGPHFSELHRLFEDHYKALDAAVDDVAERIRSLGAWAPGSLAEFLHESRLDEEQGDPPSWPTMITNLQADHENIVRSLRTNVERCFDVYEDAGTSDFLTDLMRKHEKIAWMLRALEEEPR